MQSLQEHIRHLKHHRHLQPYRNQDEVDRLGLRLASENLNLQMSSDLLVALQENNPKLDLSTRKNLVKTSAVADQKYREY